MITSIVGRLIRKPEVPERIQIPGKHIVNFTLVDHRTRGQKRTSVFFNLSVVLNTEAQFELAMRLEKGAVLLFTFPHITNTRQAEKSENDQSINIYAEADSFRILSDLNSVYSASGAAPRRMAKDEDLADPFEDPADRMPEQDYSKPG